MKVNKLLDELQKLCNNGYGDSEVAIFEKMFAFEKPYHTTVKILKLLKLHGIKIKMLYY
jgi:hypothetical protein